MQFRDLRRTTTFRLSILYGVLFALGTIALLGMIYLRSVVYLTSRVDGILNAEADALVRSPRPGLRQRVIEDLTLNGGSTNVFGLFAANGERVTGNLDALPAALRADGHPLEVPATPQFPVSVRLIARRLPTGEILVVGRDVNQLREMRSIMTSGLIWSGASILILGLACATALSIAPLKRLRRLQGVAKDIAGGDLRQRMPTGPRGDELDMFADTVNHMMAEVERLMTEVKGTTDVIAHDLLNPLATAAFKLRRLQRADNVNCEDIAQVAARMEEILDRFRAMLRIAELEGQRRRAGFVQVDLADVIEPAADLYGPLAEAEGLRLMLMAERGAVVQADPKLLFEAVSNLIDNAIKFAGRGGTVQVRTGKDPSKPQLIVQDDGPGIPSAERGAVLQKFYRADNKRGIPGSGLGLNVVAAIVRLHGFQLTLEDAEPGVRAVIEARSATEPLTANSSPSANSSPTADAAGSTSPSGRGARAISHRPPAARRTPIAPDAARPSAGGAARP